MLDFLKNKIIKVNVQKIYVKIKSKQEREYTIKVEGCLVKKNQFKSATSVLWEKILHNSFIQVNKDEYLATDNIATISIYVTEDKIVETQIRQYQNALFIS